jgi:hypothetical protein
MNALYNASIQDENSLGLASFALPEAKSSKTGVSVRYAPSSCHYFTSLLPCRCLAIGRYLAYSTIPIVCLGYAKGMLKIRRRRRTNGNFDSVVFSTSSVPVNNKVDNRKMCVIHGDYKELKE